MAAKSKAAASEHTPGLFATRMAVKIGLGVLVLLLLLSLLSHDPADTRVLDGGVGDYRPLTNWIGRFGAVTSNWLLTWLGLAAYPAVLLGLVCVLNRAFSRHLRPVGGVYFLGIFIFTWALAMLLGNFPLMLSGVLDSLNIARMPGGVIGQRFCAPGTQATPPGWMSFVVNNVGSIIISGAMTTLGLLTIWYYDWQERTERWAKHLIWRWQHRRQLAATESEPKPKPEPKPEPEAESEPEPEPETIIPEPEPEPEPEPGPTPEEEREEKIRAQLGVEEDHPEPVGPAPAPRRTPPPHSGYKDYKLPPLKLLDEPGGDNSFDASEVDAKKQVLQKTLDSFGVDATVGDATCGPRVTLFEIKPAPGVEVGRISRLSNNIAMNLKAESLRILTPIPGRDAVGIEVPNRASSIVTLREMLESDNWKKSKASIPVCLGRNISGQPVVLDLGRAPHLLIAGATGSGKSVCMNSLIMSLVYRFRPDELKMVMVDPKVVEFACYNTLPHLVCPVISDVNKVPIALRWILNQMEWRYKILSKVGVRNIASYNSRKPESEPILDDDGEPIPDHLPYTILIIDELADIMMTAKQDVETGLARIAQLARAVGIHAVVATQRPSVKVITGIIKANFPTRIAFQVTSIPDSRTILDGKGAETLLGRGDMLFKPPGGSKLERVQGNLVADDEISRVVQFVGAQAEPEMADNIFGESGDKPDKGGGGGGGGSGSGSSGRAPVGSGIGDGPGGMDEDEELILRAIEVILRDRRATTSHLQRRLRVGYNRASLIIEELEERGIVGPQIGQNPREILITEYAGIHIEDEEEEETVN